MEGTGMSLFQGAGSIHINNSAQDRLEEQEEIEDQKRRNEELQHKLANAFDDLVDDDDASSVNSSGNFTMDAGTANGGCRKESRDPRPGLPTYVESLNHLKEAQHPDTPKAYCGTPRNHQAQHAMILEEPVKLNFSPFGAGDGQNHYYHQDFRGHLRGANNYEAHQEIMDYEQLKLMYEMRVKECQQLAAQLEELRSHSDMETDSLRARLAAAVSDRDKAELSLQQAHHLLASSKHKLVELEQTVASVSDKLGDSEQEKEQLRLELRANSLSMQQLQQRLDNVQMAHTHNTDALFREQQERHREEVDRLHADLQKAKSRLEEKENEIKTLEKRFMECNREKEEILIEKGATVNRLASELEQAQSRLVSGEANRLKEKVSQLTSERNTAREQVKELGSKLEITAHELVLCRNKLATSQKEFDTWRTNLHQILADTLPDNTYLGEPPSPGKLSTLKEILNRYKLQLQKLPTLQDEISKRDKKLEHHRKLESELRSKIEEQKGVEMQLTSRVAVLQNQLELLGTSSDSELLESYKQQNDRLQTEIEECRAEMKSLDLKYTELEMEYDKLRSEKGGRVTLAQEANADLLKELERYSTQLKDTLKENGELKSLYLQACSTRDAVSREIRDIQTKAQKERELYRTQEKDYIERLERDRKQIEKLTSELSHSKEEMERANKRISELQREFTDKQKELTSKLDKYLEDETCSMRKELESCVQCDKYVKTIRNLEEQISKCSVKLAAQESNEELMKELKSKGEFFTKYILERFKKLQEQRHVATNTDHADIDVETATRNGINTITASEHDSSFKTNQMLKEQEMRDQIAQKYTLEMKTIEMNCTKRLKEMEKDHINSNNKLKQILEQKEKEVDTLKNFILHERSNITQILKAKENEISELLKEHNSLQDEYQQLKDKAGLLKDRCQEKLKALEDKHKNERELYKTAMADLEREKESLSEKYDELDADYQLLKNKYKNAKKTAFMYKDYVHKKDDHVNGELGRIQSEYMKLFMRMENRIKFLITCRMQETAGSSQDGPQENNVQSNDYSDMLQRLQSDISTLAQSKYEDAPAFR